MFQGYFLSSLFGLKSFVLHILRLALLVLESCSARIQALQPCSATGSFSISPVSLLSTHVSCFLSGASPKNCLFICFCFVGYCFCMRCLATALLCHFISFVMLSFLLAAVLRVFQHSSSYSSQLFLSFCLGGSGKLLRCLGGSGKLLRCCSESLFSFVCIRSCRSSHACLPVALVSLCCMATPWRLFFSLLNPSNLRLVHLDFNFCPLFNPPFENLQICWAMGRTCCSISCSIVLKRSTVSAPMPSEIRAVFRTSS